MKVLRLAWIVPLILSLPKDAFAGGFEIPDNGTEALGRGGAFVAKADDGEALYYNPAGFARQHGTRLTIDVNLIFHDMAFTRAGTYPGDPSDMRTPYAGMPYPTIHDDSKLFFAPNAVISTDLGGLLKHWTIAAGIYGPAAIGQHNYGVPGSDMPNGDFNPPVVNGLPAPSRYDIAQTNLLIFFPTLAVAYQPHPFIELGFAWQIYYANFDLSNANITPLGKSLCPTPDYAGCDSYGRIRTSGNSFGSSSDVFKDTPYAYSPGLSSFGWIFSLMVHPTRWLDIGWAFRPQIDVRTQGTLHPQSPPGQPKLNDADATFSSTLPAWMKLGARAVRRYADGTDKYDLELDFVYENWSAERADHVHATGDIFLWKNNTLDADVTHQYQDTFGLRLGGAYNFRLNERLRAIARAGLYWDSAASKDSLTRLDFDTFTKVGLTLGAGLRFPGFTINLAYAYVWSPTRNVADSEVTALSAINGTNYSASEPRLIIGNGRYEPSVHILSLGVTVNFSEIKTKQLMPTN